jgi:hypothetical protein
MGIKPQAENNPTSFSVKRRHTSLTSIFTLPATFASQSTCPTSAVYKMIHQRDGQTLFTFTAFKELSCPTAHMPTCERVRERFENESHGSCRRSSRTGKTTVISHGRLLLRIQLNSIRAAAYIQKKITNHNPCALSNLQDK